MVDVQNATLAGGVAVGSAADLVIQPWAAILVGLCASFVSVAGYIWLQPAMERKLHLFDTCGVHNLHGMPGVLGGISGTISAATVGATVYGQNIATVYPAMASVADGGLGRTAGEQAVAQISALLITLAIAVSTGMATGCLVKCEVFEPPKPRDFFGDHTEWDEVSDSGHESNDDPGQSLMGGSNGVKAVSVVPASEDTGGGEEAV
jgi:ammonium transporter Rh